MSWAKEIFVKNKWLLKYLSDKSGEGETALILERG
jgi:hypothetical protein